MHVAECMVYDGHITAADIVRMIGDRMHLLPRYRQKIVPAPFGIAHPTWEDDPDFDVADHVDEQTLPSPGDDRVLGWDLGVDGSGVPLLYCNHGAYIQMDGREVFRRAVRVTVESAHAALERAKLTAADIALFVPHQANLRIIEAANQRLRIPLERTAVVLDRTGNNSAGSIPLALAEAADAGRLRDGDNVLLSGFGAGMTWASVVVRWGR